MHTCRAMAQYIEVKMMLFTQYPQNPPQPLRCLKNGLFSELVSRSLRFMVLFSEKKTISNTVLSRIVAPGPIQFFEGGATIKNIKKATFILTFSFICILHKKCNR